MVDGVRFEERSCVVRDRAILARGEGVDRRVRPTSAEAADRLHEEAGLRLERALLDAGDEEHGGHDHTHSRGTSWRGMVSRPVPGVRLTTSTPRFAASLQNFSHPLLTLA